MIMSKILVIGNSMAACAAVKEARRLAPDAEIALFCTEQTLPYHRSLLPSVLSRELKENQLACEPEAWYAQVNVQLIRGEALTRVSTKRRNITTENKNHIAYEKLLITDLPGIKAVGLKGHNRNGVFYACALGSIKECARHLPFTDTVVVAASGFLGFNTACALKRLGKEVVLAAGRGLLSNVFDEETSSLIKQVVESKGIRVITDDIEEVLGDSDVKAVRLKSGKVMAAEAVVFDRGDFDHKIVAETGLLDEHNHLKINSAFKTLVDDVYACDAISGDLDLTAEESAEQGRSAMAHLLKAGDAAYQAPLPWREFGGQICDGFCGGVVRIPEGGRERMVFDGPQNLFKKVFVSDDCLVGAVWLNVPAEKDHVKQALMRRISLAGIEDRFLHSAQL